MSSRRWALNFCTAWGWISSAFNWIVSIFYYFIFSLFCTSSGRSRASQAWLGFTGLATPSGNFIASCYESSGSQFGISGGTGMTLLGGAGDALSFPLLLQLLQEREANRGGNNGSIWPLAIETDVFFGAGINEKCSKGLCWASTWVPSCHPSAHALCHFTTTSAKRLPPEKN